MKSAKTILSIAAVTTAAIPCHAQSAPSSQPNVLIIVLDDAGYNDFGFMGCPDIETPAIDSLAKDGTILTDGHVTASVSGPSRCGLLTGRYQQRGGYECNLGDKLGMNLEEKTIAKLFQNAGYKTIAVGKWHQGLNEGYHPNERGFDEFYGFTGGGHNYFPEDKPLKQGKLGGGDLQHNGKAVAFEQYLTYELGDQAKRYIKESGDQAFMMYLAYNAVHSPYQATKEDLARFEGHPRQMLAAMTYAVDKSIGEVLDTLKAEGKYDNTLIFFLSDNGGVPGNKVSNGPLKGFKGNKFEGGQRVPFIVSYKNGLPAGKTFSGLSSSLDIMATAAAAANIDTSQWEKPLDGVNLLPYLKGEKCGDPHDILFWRKDSMAAARMGDYKYIRVKGAGTRLYNLEEDLGETKDLQDSHADIAKTISQKMEEWETGLVSPLLWDEGIWDPTTIEIHRDLMNNRPVQAYGPGQYQKIFVEGKKDKK